MTAAFAAGRCIAQVRGAADHNSAVRVGGATVTVFSTIAMTGMKLIASQELTARNTTIVGLSAALGVGISQASEALSQFPEAATMIFGKSPVVIATLMAVLLNLILPKERGHS